MVKRKVFEVTVPLTEYEKFRERRIAAIKEVEATFKQSIDG